MELTESAIHSFVIRIWLEEAPTDGTPGVWRGSIVHLLDKNKVYFSNFEQLVAFIEMYMLKIEIETQK